MKYYIEHKEAEVRVVRYIEKFNEYGIPINNGASKIMIRFCPWCGKELPKSMRNEWFDILEDLGFDDPMTQDIPSEFNSKKWYTNNLG